MNTPNLSRAPVETNPEWREAALKIARGSWQRGIIEGTEAVDGSTLTGNQRAFQHQYASVSYPSLLERLHGAGFRTRLDAGYLVITGYTPPPERPSSGTRQATRPPKGDEVTYLGALIAGILTQTPGALVSVHRVPDGMIVDAEVGGELRRHRIPRHQRVEGDALEAGLHDAVNLLKRGT